ncbi:hypothetical protein H2O64_14730 [Kordia sp. YSTF-M3]|uniref:Uncharacterized protein n=1 Tax=Kordia aestuariivivens TaxID=2759037 RepID=A0ABR7QC39_9FLAO|nr:hypothetical protein [Kordia aestuariivivens]MBC8755931.1 hypothetical protein [Kordia aestuariivivens]
MLKNILKLQGVQELSKQKQKAVSGGRTEIDGVCCFNSADYYMESVPNYADPAYEGYLTHSQRHDIWLQAYDGCMAGMVNACLPAQ